TAAQRRRMIAALRETDDPLAGEYGRAAERAAAMARVARGGAFPLLSAGDTNIYALFVERALALVRGSGIVGLLTPSGIASDLSASKFFREVSTTGRLSSLFDFENRRPPRRPFFPAIDSRFKF